MRHFTVLDTAHRFRQCGASMGVFPVPGGGDSSPCIGVRVGGAGWMWIGLVWHVFALIGLGCMEWFALALWSKISCFDVNR